MRKVKLITGEYYHIFNRGVDKRDVFLDEDDLKRFFQGMQEFNKVDPIGSIYEAQVRRSSKKLGNLVSKNEEKLVDFVCYCLNPNHYHFILQQVTDRGIEKFMHKLSGGYTWHFNSKYQRTGTLFQGRYKAIHIDVDTYLLHLSAYVNLNNRVHGIQSSLWRSSWREYIEDTPSFCKRDIILNQFQDVASYRDFAERSLQDMITRKKIVHGMEKFFME